MLITRVEEKFGATSAACHRSAFAAAQRTNRNGEGVDALHVPPINNELLRRDSACQTYAEIAFVIRTIHSDSRNSSIETSETIKLHLTKRWVFLFIVFLI